METVAEVLAVSAAQAAKVVVADRDPAGGRLQKPTMVIFDQRL